MKKYFVIIGLGAILICWWYFFVVNAKQEEKIIEVPPAGEVSILGSMICLPHKDATGSQTTECAFGLVDPEGRYYSLRDSDPEYKNISGVPFDKIVTVNGIFRPEESEKYQSIGVIEVTSVR